MKQISLFREVRTLTFDIKRLATSVLHHHPGGRFSAPFVCCHHPLSLSLLRFEKTRASSRLDDKTYLSSALPSLIDSLCVCPHPFPFERLRSPPGIDRFTLEYSFLIKTAKPTVYRHSVSCSRKKKASYLNQPFLPRFHPSNPSGFSPTASFHRGIAHHSYPQLRVSVVWSLRSQGTSRALSGSWGIRSCGPRALS